MSPSSLPDLLSLFRNDVRVSQIVEALQPASARVQIGGTIGSSQAMIASSVIAQHPGVHVFVLTDKEEAAYFMNDLEAMLGGARTVEQPGKPMSDRKHDGILFFPAPSRSPYDPDGHHDGERVSRTEVLGRAHVLGYARYGQRLCVLRDLCRSHWCLWSSAAR